MPTRRGRPRGSVEIDPEARDAFTSLPVAMQQAFRSDAITRKPNVNWQSFVRDYTRYNSFIPDYPRYEFQCDCAYMNWLSEESENPKLLQNLKQFPHAFVCIDIFSKYGMVIPLKDPKYSPKETARRMPNPDPEEVAKAFRICCQDENMGQPLYVYTDAGNEFQTRFDDVCESDEWAQHIKHIKVIWAKAAYAESFIYSMKLYFLQKVKTGKLINWSNLCDDFTEQWNTEPRPILKVGGITFSPLAIHKEVKMNIIGMLKQKYMMMALNHKGEFPRYYEPLKIGDRVRYYTAGRGNNALTKKFYNQGLYRWSTEPATITRIKREDNLTWYHLAGISKPEWFLRFQLMAQERKPRPQREDELSSSSDEDASSSS